jgi:16S rRNA (cytidine1402-2'-O)-methyltransferase
MPGTLFVVATPIGNLEDITLRALRVLREVGLIAAEDTRRTANLLARHGILTPMTSLHEHNEARKSPSIVARLHRGENVALVSDAGTPVISDPGAGLIREAVAADIRVEPIPGPSAVLTALTASGLSIDQFSFAGFPPVRANDRKLWFDRLKQCGGTTVFFEAPHRILSTLEQLRTELGEVYVVVARELTKSHEELVRGPISNVLKSASRPRGEFTVIVDIGQKTEMTRATSRPATVTRRQMLSTLAAEHGLTANELYEAVEAAKKSVKRPT